MNALPFEPASPSAAPLAAHGEERLYVAAAPDDGRTRRAAIFGAALLYALLVGVVLYETRFPPPAPEAEEIPVEIIVAPPPPPEPAPPPTPPPSPAPSSAPPPPPDIAPAYDAPKESKQKVIDSAAADNDHKPPPAPPAEDTSAQRVSGAPAPLAPPSPAPASPEPTASPAPASPEAPPAPLAEQGDTPPPKPESQTAPPKPAPSKPPAPAPSATPNAKPAAGKPTLVFESLPDLDFGGANLAAPVAGGNSPATYTAILVGLFKKHIRVPAGLGPRRDRGAIAFTIDASGRLVNRWVAESSGVREMDSAAFDAVGASSPFPPPRPAPSAALASG